MSFGKPENFELKQEVELGHYEDGDGVLSTTTPTLCIAAYGFLISEKETLPPLDLSVPFEARNLPFPPVADLNHLPLRSQRNIPHSIATLRLRLARDLVRVLPDVPAAGNRVTQGEKPMNDAVGLSVRPNSRDHLTFALDARLLYREFTPP